MYKKFQYLVEVIEGPSEKGRHEPFWILKFQKLEQLILDMCEQHKF